MASASIKVYLHEGADVTRAVSQLAISALVVLKYMPPNITPPLVLRYGATDVPIIQLSLSSDSLPDTKLNDLGQNIIRPALAVVHGAEVAVSLWRQAARHHGRSRSAGACSARPVARRRAPRAAAPERHPALRRREDRRQGLYAVDEQQPGRASTRSTISRSSEVDGQTIFMRDVAHVHDGYQVQTNSVTRRRHGPAR